MDCIICQLVNEEIEVTKVYEDDFVVAVMDIQPINSGHLFMHTWKLGVEPIITTASLQPEELKRACRSNLCFSCSFFSVFAYQ